AAPADEPPAALQGDDRRDLATSNKVLEGGADVGPRAFHGRPLLGPGFPTRQAVLVARDEICHRLGMPLLGQHQCDLVVHDQLKHATAKDRFALPTTAGAPKPTRWQRHTNAREAGVRPEADVPRSRMGRPHAARSGEVAYGPR